MNVECDRSERIDSNLLHFSQSYILLKNIILLFFAWLQQQTHPANAGQHDVTQRLFPLLAYTCANNKKKEDNFFKIRFLWKSYHRCDLPLSANRRGTRRNEAPSAVDDDDDVDDDDVDVDDDVNALLSLSLLSSSSTTAIGVVDSFSIVVVVVVGSSRNGGRSSAPQWRAWTASARSVRVTWIVTCVISVWQFFYYYYLCLLFFVVNDKEMFKLKQYWLIKKKRFFKHGCTLFAANSVK